MNLNDKVGTVSSEYNEEDILSKYVDVNQLEGEFAVKNKHPTPKSELITEFGTDAQELEDDLYIEKLIENEGDTQDHKHIDALLNNTDGEAKESTNEIKSTLEYLRTMKEVAKLNNLSLEDFSKILFNSKSVQVDSSSPRTLLRKKIASSRNTRKTKYANEALEKKREKKSNSARSVTEPKTLKPIQNE